MTFHNVVKFGENSFWGWVVGSEIIVGGAIGGGAGFVVTSATGPGAVVVGVAAAIGGANATVALSNAVRTIVESDAPTPPPALPNRPPIPPRQRPNRTTERQNCYSDNERKGDRNRLR
jgi:hypothetical protein